MNDKQTVATKGVLPLNSLDAALLRGMAQRDALDAGDREVLRTIADSIDAACEAVDA